MEKEGVFTEQQSNKNPYTQEILEHKNNIITYRDELSKDGQPFFDNNQPLTLDIGSGSGNFIIHKAREKSDINYIGIETKFKRLVKSSKKINLYQLNNVKLLQRKAEDIEDYFPENSLHEIYIQFPDPWPKKRHHKNRLVNQQFLNKLYFLLQDHARIIFKTDFKDYFLIVKEIAETMDQFKIIEANEDVYKDTQVGFMTEFETIFVQSGKSISRLILEKQ